MRDFIGSAKFKILIAILTVMAGFMIMSVYTGGTASLVAQVFSFITVPFQKLSASISHSTSEFFARYTNASELYDENLALKEQLSRLNEQLADYQTVAHENEQLRQILGVMDDREDLQVETAAVIARDPSDRFYSFTIDKGSLSGVSEMDSVMTANGLVGYVSQVGLNSSKVTTILDVTIAVGAHNSQTRDIGIVTGNIDLAADGKCMMEYLPRDSQTKQGDLILTSEGANRNNALYPRGIVIGTVESVQPNSTGTSLMAIINPAENVQTVKDVFVVTHFEGQEESLN